MATLDVNIYSLNTIEDLAEALIAQANVVQCGVVNITQLAYKLGLNVYSSVMSKTSGYIKYEGSSKNIYVNSLDSVRRQRFTIAHELGHFLLHNQLLEKQGGSDHSLDPGHRPCLCASLRQGRGRRLYGRPKPGAGAAHRR